MKLVSRKAWGARRPKASPSYLGSTKGVKVHYTGGKEDARMLTDHARCVARVKSIQNGHMDGNGWNDVGYSALVCAHGDVFVGRGPHALPAANGEGLNSGHYAVCALVGNAGVTKPTDAMLNGIRDAIDWLRREGRAGSEIKGHRDGYSTDCPGPVLYAWVRKGAPRPGGKPSPSPTPRPGTSAPRWPGRYLTQPPTMSGKDVETWQRQMRARGWSIAVDGRYGPDSEKVCRAFQLEKFGPRGVDGIVGPDTWRASWESPVT